MKVLAFLIVLIGGAVAFWYYYDDLVPSEEAVITTPPEPLVEPVPERTGPLHPVAPLQAPETGKIEELPPLGDSDVSFLTALVETLGTGAADQTPCALRVCRSGTRSLVERAEATAENR